MATRIFGLCAFLSASLSAAQSSCQGQSCDIADLSGSTGQPYTANEEPVFPEQGQECCIIHYNPSVAQRLYQQVPGLQQQCQDGSQVVQTPNPVPDLSGVQCTPKILVFAAGTSQPTEGGGPLGMMLQDEFNNMAPNQWTVFGVNYEADRDGIQCVAIPGGITGTNIVSRFMSKCPNSAIFVGGYSQGAMVAHNTVGNSTTGGSIAGMLFFGDPFNGAPIKGYSGPRRTICNEGDLVCNGLPTIRPAHLDYERRTNEAAMYLNGLQVAAVGDSTNAGAATTSSVTSDTEAATSTGPSVTENAAGMTSSSLASLSSVSRSMSMSSAASMTSASMISEAAAASSSSAAATSAAATTSEESDMDGTSAATSPAPAMTQAMTDSNEGDRIFGSFKPAIAAIVGAVAALAICRL